MQLIKCIQELSQIIHAAVCVKGADAPVPVEAGMTDVLNLLLETRQRNGTVYVIGNGGSASIASHILTDFINIGKLKTQVLHDAALITCMSNDFGYEQAYANTLDTLFQENDLLIAISSSGQSKNICNAAQTVQNKGGSTITFSGFQNNNPLKKLGAWNFWLDSHDYGFVEVGHLFMLHNLVDRLKENFILEHMYE